MPIYEYRCQSCQRKTEVFLRSFSDTRDPLCTHCGSGDLARLISSFAIIRSSDDVFGPLPSFDSVSDFDEDDPQSVARMMRRLRQETGTGLSSEETAALDRMEAGEVPEEMGRIFGEGDRDA